MSTSILSASVLPPAGAQSRHTCIRLFLHEKVCAIALHENEYSYIHALHKLSALGFA